MSPGPGSEALAAAFAKLDWDEASKLLGGSDARSYCVAVDTALKFSRDMVRGELLTPQVERDVVLAATVAWGVAVGLDTAQFASLLAVAARTVDPPEPGVMEALNAKRTPGGGGTVVPFQPRDVLRRAASRHPDRTDPSTRRRRGR